ncbi:DUF962 domain-containing protein [Maribacter sp. 2304DJ31-5]|uniref:Mpo1 family 2-hydroxy fatty acid dioxygenase n=1 Tax=Maribacter sp. 2304DJ31-5 TaxID=3386273 RepID=UPI0039BCD305
MKTMDQWFEEYAVSHKNETNILIHFVCVPAIFFSIVGMLMTIPSQFLRNQIGIENALLGNWAVVILLLFLLFYLRLSLSMFLKMLLFSILCLVGNYYLGQYLPLLYVSIAFFVIAWIGQFYGHKVEGKKPSFFKDLQFLLIGPAWVVKKMFG